jgi:hypothetical protein
VQRGQAICRDDLRHSRGAGAIVRGMRLAGQVRVVVFRLMLRERLSIMLRKKGAQILSGVVLSVQLEMRDQTGQARQLIAHLQRRKGDVQIQNEKHVGAHAAKVTFLIVAYNRHPGQPPHPARVPSGCEKLTGHNNLKIIKIILSLLFK